MSAIATKKLIQQLIFGGGHVHEESIEESIDKIEAEELKKGAKRPSAYVDVFENVIKTVITHEPHLMSLDELQFLEKFSRLCYNARYCLVRLVLRKPNQWHPISNLEKFKKEVGDDGLLPAIAVLCQSDTISLVKQERVEVSQLSIKEEPFEPLITAKQEPTPHDVKLEEDEHEIIDLTIDEDENIRPVISSSAKTSSNNDNGSLNSSISRTPVMSMELSVEALLESSDNQVDLSFFCEDERAMSLQEILERLNVDQIKTLAKDVRCKVKQTQSKKSDIIAALLATAASQSILSFSSESSEKGKGKAGGDGLRQTQIPFSSTHGKKPVSQEERLKQMAAQLLGKCVRVNINVFRLVRRLHIIAYRETEHPNALLLPELLHRFKKRSYTRVDHTRSSNIWSSRKEILAYEKALHLESLLDEIIDGPKDKDKHPQTRAQSQLRAKSHFATPESPGPNSKPFSTSSKNTGSVSYRHSSETPVKAEKGRQCNPLPDALEEPIVENRKEVVVMNHIDSWLYGMCKECVSQCAQQGRKVAPGLERFTEGYVAVRMLCKATSVLGPLKEYNKELDILTFMLSQKFWRRGKRAQWYRRKTIILGHLIRQAESLQKKISLRGQCLLVLREGLLDEDVGIVWRPDLISRLMKLEKQLEIPEEQRSTSDGRMRRPEIVEVHAIKVANPLKFDNMGRPIVEKENTPDILAYMISKQGSPKVGEPAVNRKTGKSCWQGRNGIVNVETIALENYEDQGYIGFHSETKLLTTIFGLLFWDIIFADVPGAFETPFQFAPLDIFEDTFYHARKVLIDTRLRSIREDGWRELLQRHDDAYREKKTWCIGVNWDFCSKEDLMDIFECIGKDSLAIICELLCQDYKGRSSGGPDLFVWNTEKRICKFVEVKGPGDRPQENQKYWFDSLHRANVDIEICKVIDDADKTDGYAIVKSKKRKASKTPNIRGHRKSISINNVSDTVDYEALDPEPEDDHDCLAPNSPRPPSSRKRRRISEAAYKLEYSDQIDQFNTLDSSGSRPAGSEALITPSKIRCTGA